MARAVGLGLSFDKGDRATLHGLPVLNQNRVTRQSVSKRSLPQARYPFPAAILHCQIGDG